MGVLQPCLITRGHLEKYGCFRPNEAWLLTCCGPFSQLQVDLEDPHNIAQIVQGAGFIALAMWLIFANNSKVSDPLSAWAMGYLCKFMGNAPEVHGGFKRCEWQ